MTVFFQLKAYISDVQLYLRVVFALKQSAGTLMNYIRGEIDDKRGE